ncbi:MAG: ABC transporter permease [Phycisphaerae bacterium]|nr:ABC transporter permease [Phycisphaerae bacterium]
MTRRAYILRSLWFYRRTHVGVVLTAAVATGVLVGALLVGDSVRGSLRALARARLGETRLALETSGRFVRQDLADELAAALDAPAAPILELSAAATASDRAAGGVRVLGVDARFWGLGEATDPFDRREGVVVNRRLARRLDLAPGNTLSLRIARPQALSRDVPLASDQRDRNRDFVRLDLPVLTVVGAERFGRFDLRANQAAPRNAFVPLARLQEAVGLAPGIGRDEPHRRVNGLLLGDGPGMQAATAALRQHFTLADAEAELRPLPAADDPRVVELRSRRVFLAPALVAAAGRTEAPALGVSTYLANAIRPADGDSVRPMPYAMISAVGGLGETPAPEAMPADPAWRIARALTGDDRARINAYLARQLAGADGAPPDALRVRYYRYGNGRLAETSARVAIAGDPLAMPTPSDGPDGLLLRRLTPSIPALPDDATFADLKALGTRIDRDVIDRNAARLDAYYGRYRLTPMAYLPLDVGRRWWGMPQGDLTGVRFDADAAPAVRAAVREHLDPSALGVFFRPVRREALQAGRQSMDFGQLFAAMSMFLVVAAVLLLGLLFVFGIQQRREEIGLLRAVGFSPRQVRRLLLGEGAVLAAVGAAIGTAGGAGYAAGVLRGLATVWRDAVPEAAIAFHATPASVVGGAAAGLLVAVGAMALALWRQARRAPHALLRGQDEPPGGAGGRRWKLAAGGTGVCLLAAAGVLAGVGAGAAPSAATGFFIAGALLLAALLSGAYAVLARPGAARRLTLGRLARRNAARRRGRSIATIGLLACGSFLIVAVSAHRSDPLARADTRDSGTGGFALQATTAVGLLHAPDTPQGRQTLDLGAADLSGASFVPLRVRDGDEASCLNLNRPQRPRLLGVDPRTLTRRGAFAFADTWDGLSGPRRDSWDVLNAELDDGAIPAVADLEAIRWVLHKALGDTLTYRDANGREFRVRLVAGLANSILQGSVVIAERHFVARYPNVEGYRMFLIDVPPGEMPRVRDALAAAPDLRAAGIELTPTRDRLAALLGVANTYVAIFQALGGLGLVLGTVALGLVVARNVAERRGELALLRAVGFTRRRVDRLLLAEHWLLLGAGLVGGAVAGLVATAPNMLASGGGVPYGLLAALLAAVGLSGAASTYLATRLATRGRLLPALRNE